MLNANELMIRKAMESGNTVQYDALVNDPTKLRHLMDIKTVALGNARLLYGSEQRKFFDIVTGLSEDHKFTAVLVCSFDGKTKILRKEIGNCPLSATRLLVDGLQKDTGLLLTKYDVGDQIYGQQGFRGESGKFELDEYKVAVKDSGPVDDTSTLYGRYKDAPKGPGDKSGGFKRSRADYS